MNIFKNIKTKNYIKKFAMDVYDKSLQYKLSGMNMSWVKSRLRKNQHGVYIELSNQIIDAVYNNPNLTREGLAQEINEFVHTLT